MVLMLRNLGLRTCKTVEDLPIIRTIPLSQPIQQQRRQRIKISVIDDQPFEAGVNLRSYGYNITEIGDVKNISEVSDYPIVLCDIMAVGHHFDKKNQGAAVIQEIRKNYPAILVAAYSGSSNFAEPAQRAKLQADAFIKKDADIDTWVHKLDELISMSTDATFLWYRIRKALIEENLNSREILRLEDAYVRAILEKDQSFALLKKAITGSTAADAVTNIIHGLISSTIFRAIVGT